MAPDWQPLSVFLSPLEAGIDYYRVVRNNLDLDMVHLSHERKESVLDLDYQNILFSSCFMNKEANALSHIHPLERQELIFWMEEIIFATCYENQVSVHQCIVECHALMDFICSNPGQTPSQFLVKHDYISTTQSSFLTHAHLVLEIFFKFMDLNLTEDISIADTFAKSFQASVKTHRLQIKDTLRTEFPDYKEVGSSTIYRIYKTFGLEPNKLQQMGVTTWVDRGGLSVICSKNWLLHLRAQHFQHHITVAIYNGKCPLYKLFKYHRLKLKTGLTLNSEFEFLESLGRLLYRSTYALFPDYASQEWLKRVLDRSAYIDVVGASYHLGPVGPNGPGILYYNRLAKLQHMLTKPTSRIIMDIYTQSLTSPLTFYALIFSFIIGVLSIVSLVISGMQVSLADVANDLSRAQLHQ
ncbi:hypothetical protein NEOLI_004542 [Neolecta irregularis DAH-3]|uniref:Uncharacterized protein n=1 Tax=Neolecta irregularis (strain DAH-3) TaxID=1198029 RepID=A0A1U7LI37_NEOID|nr:hypothetical protein NEOLI_004542 [Neolecta irregularis DAH-3]|eukprot:OLL22212.1 hypothetical protein NEOLI_004542 [Neolecta irregularis DAH-3]